jgi:hypothetical protein
MRGLAARSGRWLLPFANIAPPYRQYRHKRCARETRASQGAYSALRGKAALGRH